MKKIIEKVPDTSGVYLMKDKDGCVIYVGKAKSLKKRLNSYMGRDLDTKTLMLMANVSDIEYRLTPTESLALLLEASLIHKYHPRYNISLRDDKSFPMVKITHEAFPAICITRKIEPDGSRYLGPYTSAGLLREALKIIRRHFPYRSCRELPRKACIYYRIGLSPGPCIGKISRREYARTIKNITMLLEGRGPEALIKRLSRQMKQSSKSQRYEEAARMRDQITALGALGETHAGSGNQEESEDLKKLLHLRKLPERIEAFDISNIRGQEATGSMVSFYRGIPDKNNYRKFRIKTVQGVDDYKMLAEVVRRRYRRLKEEDLPLPDLILIDGGKGHLSTVQEELKGLKLNIPLASIAKEEENLYVTGRALPIKSTRDTAGLNLIRRVRDEAHRFAVAYHHVLRRKRIIGK
ncbi:MAG: UvrB/UvrC motif-containing protein [Candidatus Omnitrophota bacterium]